MIAVFRWMLRLTLLLLLVAGVALGLVWYLATRSLPDYDATYTVEGITAPVRIVRDTQNVPHIFGQTDADSFFGLGFVHAQDRLWQMTMMRRTAQGRLSELFGSRTLKIAISASGARYTGDGLQWWTKGVDQGQLSPLAPGEDIATAQGVNCKAPDASTAPVSPPPPGAPGGLPDDRTPVSEGAFTPESAQGAANVVQTYFALIGAKKYDEARKLWSDGGKASGMTAQAFAASFDKYASYNAEIGAPGEIEGAAGSLYVQVPVVIYGRLKSGEEVHMNGPVSLRRVNDVPGSTEEQRRWRIAETALKPSPKS